ncbi:DUF3072 domain-containing protein [Salinarimonas chemoclinalis]|uniref:DUF3072 domain-containing protein n=1 Tax=Salinarimonas chemoclinalis TaxID=3241599 RepID=UPI0035590D7D
MPSQNDHARGAHEDPPEVQNPERNPEGNPKQTPPADNKEKDPEEWVTGHEPMTGAQASYLKTLSEQAHAPELYDPRLDKAEASKRIDELRARTGKG